MFATKTNRRFWLFMALLPILAYLVSLFRLGDITLNEFLITNMGFLNVNGNIVLQLFNSMFGLGGYLPCCSIGMCMLLSWWVYIKIAHIITDILTLLPDVCAGFIELLTRRKDDDKM